MIKAFIFLIIFLFIAILFFVSNKYKKKSFLFLISILFTVFLIFSIALISLDNDKSEKVYFPPKYDGSEIVPGHFNEKN